MIYQYLLKRYKNLMKKTIIFIFFDKKYKLLKLQLLLMN